MEKASHLNGSELPRHVAQALGLAEQLYRLADGASETCDKEVCLVFFGIVRDCAHAIRSAAEQPALQRMLGPQTVLMDNEPQPAGGFHS